MVVVLVVMGVLTIVDADGGNGDGIATGEDRDDSVEGDGGDTGGDGEDRVGGSGGSDGAEGFDGYEDGGNDGSGGAMVVVMSAKMVIEGRVDATMAAMALRVFVMGLRW